MPDFPRAHSERALTTKQPRAMRDDADIRNEAGQKAKVAGAAVADVTKSLMEWNGYVEKVQRDTGFFQMKTGQQEIANRAVQEQDINKEGEYQKQQQDLKKSILGSINSERVKRQMAAELNYMETVGAIGIQTEFHKKTVLHDQARSEADLEILSQTPGSEEQIKDRIKKDTGSTWNEKEAGRLERKYIGKMKENWQLQVMNKNMKKAKKMMVDNDFGFTTAEANAAWKRLEYQGQVIRDSNEDLLTDMDTNEDPKLTPELVIGMRDTEMVDANFANKMVTDIKTPSYPTPRDAVKDAQANTLLMKYKELKSKEAWNKQASFAERAQFRADVYEAKQRKWITKDNKDYYFDKTRNQYFKSKEFLNSLDGVWNISEDKYDSKPKQEIAKYQISGALMEKIWMEKKSPAVALEEAVNEQIVKDFGYSYQNLLDTQSVSGETFAEIAANMEEMKNKQAGE